MASFSLFFSDCSKWDFLGGWAFWDPHFWGHFWLFSQKTLASRGLHYYGMILPYIWVRFKHFPPLVDFSSLKTPSRHMCSRLGLQCLIQGSYCKRRIYRGRFVTFTLFIWNIGDEIRDGLLSTQGISHVKSRRITASCRK